ncbi:MAG: mannose-1-phosphate guanylyltransferase [Phaeodactylibacter xiamenensis]|uniref:mannose-1-phosphate guanylyltransferase n=1 Tax=Phaeodactylibacter xiamenensis TaxID=1524460 RepID=A0A098S3Z3_9BACT|nr:mannose-1-phosphate guanylyltransferase [Phaeodactylibacter xiamenensis]KGE86756.1 mannose-1-phosphate guanylyltransferase [Phaeodactylibacter xiamenensis]MCR9055407.1 mannose-1-phosphate guanylyltransferase [bacterium]
MPNNSNTYVAIMAGGIGSRFWPASREERPKQFLDILGVGKSLIRLTFERFLKLCPASNIFIVTNKQYAGLVKEHLPELTDNQILTEPSRNNTAPCIAYTAFKLQALNPDANLVVAPSDHIILKEDTFVETLQQGLAFTAANDALLTLGITPTRPDTGYGYIEIDPKVPGDSNQPKSVKAFREKPDRPTAQQYLDSGNYLWNAGIFVWRVSSLLKAFAENAPEIHRILGAGAPHYNTPQEQAFIDEAYPTTPSISVDYAIMEKAGNVFTIPSDFGWSDLGTWASLHAESPKDDQSNVAQGSPIQLIDTQDTLVRAPKGKRLVIGGLDDYIVVDEGDVLLIWPKSREQEIKHLVDK